MDKRKMSFDDFKNHCNKIFHHKYDYSKSDYRGMKHPLLITCPIHGDFIQKAQSHYLGHHCSKCNGSIRLSKGNLLVNIGRYTDRLKKQTGVFETDIK